MLDALKVFDTPVKKVIGFTVSAIVLIWFWHPVWHFVGELAGKADKIFP